MRTVEQIINSFKIIILNVERNHTYGGITDEEYRDDIEESRQATINELNRLVDDRLINWWDDDRFIYLKNQHTDLLCDKLLNSDGVGKFGNPKMNKIVELLKPKA